MAGGADVRAELGHLLSIDILPKANRERVPVPPPTETEWSGGGASAAFYNSS